MAAWFGHTQTLTSISKSVTTVAGGIMGLEDNLATFMKKVPSRSSAGGGSSCWRWLTGDSYSSGDLL